MKKNEKIEVLDLGYYKEITSMVKLILASLEKGNERLLRLLDEYSEELTPREQEIMGMITEGKINKEIAKALFISETTVKAHLRSILGKLHVRNRAAAAAAWTNRQTIAKRTNEIVRKMKEGIENASIRET